MSMVRPIALKLSVLMLVLCASAFAQPRGGGASIFSTAGPDAPPGISGAVTDADTGLPIKQFRIIPTRLPTSGMANRPAPFNPDDARLCADGKYDLRAPARIPSGSGGFVIRVEADGYIPEVSQIFRITPTGIEQATWDVKLRKAINLTGTVKLPSGQPAVGAQVVLCSYEFPARLENGKVVSALRTSMTDKDGNYSIAPDRAGFSLLFLHDGGSAIVKDQDLSTGVAIQLQAWASVTGIARSGPAKPIADTLVGLKSDTPTPTLYSVMYETKTSADGGYQFEHILSPQRFTLTVSQTSIFAAPLSAQVTRSPMIHTMPGRTTVADIGGVGRPIKGRIVFPDDLRGGQLLNNNGVAFWTVPPPLNRASEVGAQDWQKQREIDETLMSAPEYRNYLETRRTGALIVAADWTFHADDVEPGNYIATFNARMPQSPTGRGPAPIRTFQVTFTMPSGIIGNRMQPLDLGDLRAEVYAPPR